MPDCRDEGREHDWQPLGRTESGIKLNGVRCSRCGITMID